MSLLLDALNKADEERKRNDATPSIHSHHENAQQYNAHKIATPVLLALVAIGIVFILLGVYWLGKYMQKTSNAPEPIAVSISSAAALPASSHAAIHSSAVQSSQSSNTSITENKIESTPAGPDIIDANTQEESVANLYQQKNSQPSPETISPPQPNSTVNTTSSINTAASTTPTNSINQFSNLPEIHDLPTQVLNKIPSLNYSEHNFNVTGGSVKINGQIKHVNDQVAAGVVIDKILEDGMILHVDNYIFKMRALNSWVNM